MTDSPNEKLAEEIERLALEGPLGAYAARHVFYEHWQQIVAALRSVPAQGMEKDAARYRFLSEQHNDWHVERWMDTLRGSGTWQSIRGTTLTRAIDAAIDLASSGQDGKSTSHKEQS